MFTRAELCSSIAPQCCPQSKCRCTDLFHVGKQLEEQGRPGGIAETRGVGREDAEADALLLEGLSHTQGEG